jgi:hypothetical protein
VFICLQHSTEPGLVQAGMRSAERTCADAVKFTSRILEDLLEARGLVEPWEGSWLSL